jgi:hypothetical protein
MFRYKDTTIDYDTTFAKAKNPENVIEIFLNDCPSLDGIERFVNLERLNCKDCNVDDLTPLSGCLNLRQLLCSYNKVKSLIPLRNCKKLVKLDCAGNKLTNLEGLENCIELEKLNCGNNMLTSLVGLDTCKKLELLNFDLNYVKDFTGLENCRRLMIVWACQNSFGSAKGLNTAGSGIINFYYSPKYVSKDVITDINAIHSEARDEDFDDSDELERIWWEFE